MRGCLHFLPILGIHALQACSGELSEPEFPKQVTFLQATKRARVCKEAKILNAAEGLTYECLSLHHFTPDVVESTPYEPLAQALAAWTRENPTRSVPTPAA